MSEIGKIVDRHLTVEWKAENFFSLLSEEDFYMYSPNFSFSGADLYLDISSNDTDEGWVSISLCFDGSSFIKYLPIAYYTLGIRKKDFSTFKSRSKISEARENLVVYEETRFIMASELKVSKDVISLDDSLIVFCTIRDCTRACPIDIASHASQTVSSEGVEILQRNFKELLVSERSTDVAIKVQNKEFHAHRLILAARSPVFFSMFDHDTEEKKSGIVNITDLEPESFKDFLSYIYTGRMDIVSSSNMVSLYKAADKYYLEDLKNECVRFMVEELSSESFCHVIVLASMHNESRLLDTAIDFFTENSKDIFLTCEWQSLMKEHPTLANELLVKMSNKKL